MKHLVLATLLFALTPSVFAAGKDVNTMRMPAGVTTPDDFTKVKSITLLDGGSLYSGAIMFRVNENDYALPVEANGSLSPMNQRIYDTLLKVMAGQLRLQQIHTFDGKTIKAGDFSYKVVAAINIANK